MILYIYWAMYYVRGIDRNIVDVYNAVWCKTWFIYAGVSNFKNVWNVLTIDLCEKMGQTNIENLTGKELSFSCIFVYENKNIVFPNTKKWRKNYEKYNF